MKNFEVKARTWMTSDSASAQSLEQSYYCQTRDIFRSRFDRMRMELLNNKKLAEDTVYIISAIVGEIGNNSFDHNIGNWPDMPGIFFGYEIAGKTKHIVLADRGQGVLTTLQNVKPDLKNEVDALQVAFKERISGRSPEQRGNGLKFVRESVKSKHLHLDFYSGSAKATLRDQIIIQPCDEAIRGCLAILTFSDTMQA